MNELNEEERRLRWFLLDELSEEERQRVEELFLVDPEYRERVLTAEDDLIEDYAEGSLSEAERQRVRLRILSAPQQRRKLKVARLIKKYVDVETAAHSPPADGKIKQLGGWHRGVLGLRRPYVSIPLAAILLLAVGFGVLKLVELRRLSEQEAREQSRRVAVEGELARLNDATLSSPAEATIFSLVLPPVFVRDLKAAPRVSPSAAAVVELRLLLVRSDYEAYRVVLQKLGDSTQFTIPNLRAQTTNSGQAVNLKIPIRLLTRGDYQLRLNGVNAEGQMEEIGEYNFQVAD